MHTLYDMRCATQEISENIWKLILVPALESGKSFCILDNFVIFGDVYIIQHYAFLIFESLRIVQMIRQNV